MMKLKLSICFMLIVNLFILSSAHAFFGFFEKKTAVETKPVVEEKLSEEDRIGFVDRSEKDLSQLKSLKLFVPDALDDNSIFKIKSVLQDNDNIYKVIQSDLKNYVVYFKEGKAADTELVLSIVTAAGYNPQIK